MMELRIVKIGLNTADELEIICNAMDAKPNAIYAIRSTD